MSALWIYIPVGLLIGLCAVGIPFWMTHRRMHPHHDLSEAAAYLESAGKTPQDAVQGRPGRRARGQVTRSRSRQP